MQCDAIVMGASAGGLWALSAILERLPENFPAPVIIVQHRARDESARLEEVLQAKTRLRVKQADEKESIQEGMAYIAPPDYHLLVEKDRSFSLSCDPPVLYSRPSIDVLFESAARVYESRLAGIILTGANRDGAAGMEAIQKRGGITIAQDPSEAQYTAMPQAAIDTGSVQYIFTLKEIKDFLAHIHNP